MITRIGIVAGEIWHYLDGRGLSTFSAMCAALDFPPDLILMSLGWLAREGHVVVEKEAIDLVLSLRQLPPSVPR